MKIVIALIALISALAIGCGGGEEEGSCERISEACHNADEGSGKPYECHELAEGDSGDEACYEEEDACMEACQ